MLMAHLQREPTNQKTEIANLALVNNNWIYISTYQKTQPEDSQFLIGLWPIVLSQLIRGQKFCHQFFYWPFPKDVFNHSESYLARPGCMLSWAKREIGLIPPILTAFLSDSYATRETEPALLSNPWERGVKRTGFPCCVFSYLFSEN